MIQLLFVVQFSSSKSQIHTCGLHLNYDRVITITFFQGIKILVLIRHNAYLNTEPVVIKNRHNVLKITQTGSFFFDVRFEPV